MATVTAKATKLSGHVITDDVLADMRMRLDSYEAQFGRSSAEMMADPATADVDVTGDRELADWQFLYGHYLALTTR